MKNMLKVSRRHLRGVVPVPFEVSLVYALNNQGSPCRRPERTGRNRRALLSEPEVPVLPQLAPGVPYLLQYIFHIRAMEVKALPLVADADTTVPCFSGEGLGHQSQLES
ncbi:unnamed protein product [Symbiodinium sp. CCMP2592]|nr:unnamed protein product [Symbiodinium sp. CCMP2592]